MSTFIVPRRSLLLGSAAVALMPTVALADGPDIGPRPIDRPMDEPLEIRRTRVTKRGTVERERHDVLGGNEDLRPGGDELIIAEPAAQAGALFDVDGVTVAGEQLGARLEVVSAPGQGCSVRVRLPVRRRHG